VSWSKTPSYDMSVVKLFTQIMGNLQVIGVFAY